MDTSIFVLIMLFATGDYRGGLTTVQQEFSTVERCEAARMQLEKAHNGQYMVLRAQGCFKK